MIDGVLWPLRFIREGVEESSDNQFVMRCWTREELDSVLSLSGFDAPTYFGAYDATIAAGASDRLVVTTRLRRAPA